MKIYNNATSAWISNLKEVYYNGKEINPRGIETKELLSIHCVFDMNYPVCQNAYRKLSYKFMAAEAYWIISGSMFTEDIVQYNKHIGNFSDDNYIFNGNYGVPYFNQLEYVVNTLLNDKYSRQAAMTLWRPNMVKTKDYPCTISLIFMIRNNKLHTQVTMRSQDLFLGQPYDFFNFTMMTLRILEEYNKRSASYTQLGNLYWNGMSTHIYEKDFDKIKTIIENEHDNYIANKVPKRLLNNWPLLSQSLIDCRDSNIGDTLRKGSWAIRLSNIES